MLADPDVAKPPSILSAGIVAEERSRESHRKVRFSIIWPGELTRKCHISEQRLNDSTTATSLRLRYFNGCTIWLWLLQRFGSLMSQQHEIDDDLDAAYVARVRPYIERLAQAEEDVILDFSKVEFVDSSGLGALVFLHKRLVSKGHKLRVVGLRGQPLQLFTNLHLVPLFCE